MIEPITPIPLFLVELDPVDYDEYDSAAIACRSREILDELLDGAFARTNPECNSRVAYKYGFEIGCNQHVTSVTEIGTYTLGIPDGKDAVIVLSSFNAG